MSDIFCFVKLNLHVSHFVRESGIAAELCCQEIWSVQNTCVSACCTHGEHIASCWDTQLCNATYSIMAQTTILLLLLTINLESRTWIGLKLTTLISKSADVYRTKIELDECMRLQDEQRFISLSHNGHNSSIANFECTA